MIGRRKVPRIGDYVVGFHLPTYASPIPHLYSSDLLFIVNDCFFIKTFELWDYGNGCSFHFEPCPNVLLQNSPFFKKYLKSNL